MTPGQRGVPGGSGTLPTVRLYVTSDCHLCRVARSLLTALQRTIPFNIETIGIEGDADLERRFVLEVPVVEVDGRVVASGQVDLDAVRAAVNDARINAARRAATGE